MHKFPLALAGAFLLLCPFLMAAAEEEAPADQLVIEEQQHAEKKRPKKKPVVEIHGDYRLLYGEGRFSGKAGPYAFH